MSAPASTATTAGASATPTAPSTVPPSTPSATPSGTPDASSAAPSASASVPDFSAYCIVPSEYKGVVHFKAGDDTVEALELGSGKVGVVLAHQYGQTLCAWQSYAHVLANKGYRVIDISFGGDLVGDVIAAAAQLRAKGSTKVMLVGASMGGTTVVAAAALIKPRVAAVIDLSGPSTFENVNAIDAAPKLAMPAFFVASKNDTPFADNIRAMYAAAVHSPGRKLLIRAGNEHGIDMVHGSTRAAIEAFLRQH
jgi:pimeloyl-ACP methyl ester carboxylesterase